MTYDEALKLLRSFPIKEGHDWDRHCINVGDTAYRLALELKKYTAIDPERVRLMGLVHDFGRSVSQDPYRHAYEGHKMMMALNEPELARVCVCHSNGTYRPEDIAEYGLKPEDFFVRTMEEKLVFIADNLESHGRIIRQKERLAETIERYKINNPEFVPVLYQKFQEFDDFDSEIRSICKKGIYDILGI